MKTRHFSLSAVCLENCFHCPSCCSVPRFPRFSEKRKTKKTKTKKRKLSAARKLFRFFAALLKLPAISFLLPNCYQLLFASWFLVSLRTVCHTQLSTTFRVSAFFSNFFKKKIFQKKVLFKFQTEIKKSSSHAFFRHFSAKLLPTPFFPAQSTAFPRSVPRDFSKLPASEFWMSPLLFPRLFPPLPFSFSPRLSRPRRSAFPEMHFSTTFPLFHSFHNLPRMCHFFPAHHVEKKKRSPRPPPSSVACVSCADSASVRRFPFSPTQRKVFFPGTPYGQPSKNPSLHSGENRYRGSVTFVINPPHRGKNNR